MKKTVRTLVGTAVLFSVLTSYAGAEIRAVGPSLQTSGKERKSKKGCFSEIDKVEKKNLEECMAKDLSVALGKPKEEVERLFSEGKSAKEIVTILGADERRVEKELQNIHKEKMKEKVREGVETGKISEERAQAIIAKISAR